MADVDFADVFGGPPRRSSGASGQGSRRRSSMDSSSRSRSGAEERPVFGERTSSDRRSQRGEEFYKDIFAGGESGGSPRRSGGGAGDRDVFGAPASPGSASRLRSSFSMKFNEGMENSVPTSPSQNASNRNDDGASYAYSVPTSPNSSLKSFLAQGVPPQDSGKSRFSWQRYPFLSRFRSQSADKKENSQYVSSMDSEYERTPVSLDSYVANANFHFSFYKWAGKGAFLVLPTTTQEKVGDIVRVRSFPQVVVQGIDLIDEEDNISTATGASKSQTDFEDYKSVKDGISSASSKPKEGGLSLVFDDYMQVDKAEETETKRSIDNAKNNVSWASPSFKSSQSPSGDKSRGNRVKGKVKDFMKIFSPEGSPKRKGAPEAQDQTSSVKNGNRGGPENKFSISSLEVNDDVRTPNMSNQNVFPTASSPMSEVQDRTEAPVLTVDNEIQTKGDQIFGRKEESIHDETKDKEGDTTYREESRIEDFEECVVEHLSEDLVLRDKEKEQMKISESKIREWSKGKEGNIRSLLSTLQNVLWPGSGWKPVPLVDIIEGAGVKKAYQKALLCLHPDKLQQRGAAMHQKYIAEKVFDILQEAWKEFNSVSFG